MKISFDRANQLFDWQTLECRECRLDYDPNTPVDATSVDLCPRCLTIYRGRVAEETAKFERDYRKMHPEPPRLLSEEERKERQKRTMEQLGRKRKKPSKSQPQPSGETE